MSICYVKIFTVTHLMITKYIFVKIQGEHIIQHLKQDTLERKGMQLTTMPEKQVHTGSIQGEIE